MTSATPTQEPLAPPRGGPGAAPRSLRSDLDRLRSQLVAAIEDNPLAAAATAAAIGFVLGGGLTRPTLGLLIQTGSRVAANRLGAAFQHAGPHDFDDAGEEIRA